MFYCLVFYSIILVCSVWLTYLCIIRQGFGREKDENHTDLCLRSIVFSYESGHL